MCVIFVQYKQKSFKKFMNFFLGFFVNLLHFNKK